MCTFYFVYSFTTLLMDQIRKHNLFFYFEFHVFLNSFITLAIHALLAKKLSNVISFFKVGYVSYFNKLLRPVQLAFKIICVLLQALLLYNLNECALLIYFAIYLAKDILRMFHSVIYHLQEYLCKILLTKILLHLYNQNMDIPAKLIGGGGAALLGLVFISGVVL